MKLFKVKNCIIFTKFTAAPILDAANRATVSF